MTNIDVAIVGGGPAGATCARALVAAGLDVAVLDQSRFPRDKVCAGWITPGTVEALDLDLDDYRRRCVLEPLRAFRVGLDEHPALKVDYERPVSYAVRRTEFDDYLLRRANAWVAEGARVTSIERVGGRWVIEGTWAARYVVGAGGHRCPVARHLNQTAVTEVVVVAQRVESRFAVVDLEPGTVELVFSTDLRGYGWVVPKGGWVNIGFGRDDPRQFRAHVRRFADRLTVGGRLDGAHLEMEGHAYLLASASRRRTVGDGILLVGDAAGVAAPGSGEGIGQAVRSGLMAAEAIRRMAFEGDRLAFARYADALRQRFGTGRPAQPSAAWIPGPWRREATRAVFASKACVRHLVLDRVFLREAHRTAHERENSLRSTRASNQDVLTATRGRGEA